MNVSLSNDKSSQIKAGSLINKNLSSNTVASLEKQKKVLIKQKKNYKTNASKNGVDPKTVKLKTAAFDKKIKNIDKQIASAKSKAKSNPSTTEPKVSSNAIKNKLTNSTTKKEDSKKSTLATSVEQLKVLSTQKKNKTKIDKNALKNYSAIKVEGQINSYRKNNNFDTKKVKKSFSLLL